MSKLLLLTLLLISRSYCQAQFHYILSSTPDSAIVKVNGQERCFTPCKVSYRWRDAINGYITIEMSVPGHEAWKDTISEKPWEFTNKHHVSIQRKQCKYDIGANTPIIAFDRLLAANFSDGMPIGKYTDERGKVEIIKWEGSTKIGEKAFERKFNEIVSKAGFKTPQTIDPKLFSGQTNGRQETPRYLVGAKLVEYDVNVRHDEGPDHGAGKVVGSTRMGLEWQVQDRSTGEIVLTRSTIGGTRTRTRSRHFFSENLIAFEDALIQFLDNGGLVELVNSSSGASPFTADSSRTANLNIARPAIPSFNSFSEVIKYADKACVTVVTDNGHGSGVIIDPEGHILSAYHVVDRAHRIDVQFSDGLKQQASIRSFDIENDVVLLEIAGSGYRALPMGRSDSLSLGDEVFTIGTPADLSLGQSVARGILSGKRLFEDNVYLQTDMSVSPGNSGGPLLNSKGEVVGIIQRKVVMSGVEGIGFAIPMERAAEKLHIQVN